MVESVAPIEIATPPKRYRPAGRCIYCGRRATKLSKEHIIPYGLAANSLVLPSASCRRCQQQTRDFETICLRHMWWPFRTRIGAPSRGKEKPTEFELKNIRVRGINDDGSLDYERTGITKIVPEQYPLIYIAFAFP